MLANLLDMLAWLAGLRDEPTRVLRLAGAAAALRERVGAAEVPALAADVHPIAERARRWLRARAQDAWRQGSNAEPAHAIAYALGEVEWEATAHGAPPADTSGLTPREIEVALLVAKGMPDKQIATELGIRVRTAEYHVEQLRRKLGCSSRTQVAMWVAEHDLKPAAS